MMRSVFNSWAAFLVVCGVARAIPKKPPHPPKPQLYREQWRPQYHFTPPKHFMNDPCGLVAYDGVYHLFYGYDPVGLGPTRYSSWGHAVSTDLLHWEIWPLAIAETAGMLIFSGSTVVDFHNTSGFSTDSSPAMVIIFTGNLASFREMSDQRLTYSIDGGITWTMYAGNPVLTNGLIHFRDPKVIWYEPSKQWLMVVAQARGKRAVQFYSSPDLKKWTYLSEKGPEGLIFNKEWETPNFFQLHVKEENITKWILPSMTGAHSRPRRTVMYWTGEFDGKQFTADQTRAKILDFGPDFTAIQTWTNHMDDRMLITGWMCVWESCIKNPTRPWQGAQAITRELSLARENGELILVQKPIRELEKLRTGTLWKFENVNMSVVNESLTSKNAGGQLLEINATFRPATGTKNMGFKLMVGEDEHTIVGYDHVNQTIYIDRSRSGHLNNRMGKVYYAKVVLQENVITMNIFLDWSSVEFFANGGRQVITTLIFPVNKTSDGVQVFWEGEDVEVINLTVHRLKTIWGNYWGKGKKSHNPTEKTIFSKVKARYATKTHKLPHIRGCFGFSFFTQFLETGVFTYSAFISVISYFLILFFICKVFRWA